MERPARRPQKGRCFICNGPIFRGDGVRWVTHAILVGAQISHARCVEADWEFLEVGLEPFPPLRSADRAA